MFGMWGRHTCSISRKEYDIQLLPELWSKNGRRFNLNDNWRYLLLSFLIALLMSSIANFTTDTDDGWSLLNISLAMIAIIILTGKYWAV